MQPRRRFSATQELAALRKELQTCTRALETACAAREEAAANLTAVGLHAERRVRALGAQLSGWSADAAGGGPQAGGPEPSRVAVIAKVGLGFCRGPVAWRELLGPAGWQSCANAPRAQARKARPS